MYIFCTVVFKRIGKDPNIRVKIDNYHCTAVIHACGQNRQWWTALEIFEVCKRDGRVAVNAVVYGAAMTACVNGKRYDKALTLFDELKISGIKMDTSCYNIALRAAAKYGKHDYVLETFSTMLDNELKPDQLSYMALLQSCAISGDHKRAISLLADMKKVKWLKPNVKMYTAVVSSCIKAGDTVKALEMLREASAVSSVTLKLAEQEETGDISSDLLSKHAATRHSGGKFNGLGDAPDSLLLGLGIVACSLQPGYGSLAVGLFEEIIANNMKPTYSHISHVIRSLELDANTSECIRIYRFATAAGYLQDLGDDMDLIEKKDYKPPRDFVINVNVSRIYGDHMIRTRMNSFFEFLLRKRVTMSSTGHFNPRLLLVIGRDEKKKYTAEQYLKNNLLCGEVLEAKWLARECVFTVAHTSLDTWVAARMQEARKK
jgi:pentatricopeptide repeat protein